VIALGQGASSRIGVEVGLIRALRSRLGPVLLVCVRPRVAVVQGSIRPDEVLSHASSPEDISRAYRRFGASFTVDSEGVLDLEEVEESLQEKRTLWTVETR
jgi:hypothetical protein